MKWHPIKTAPKDREVLLYYPPGALDDNAVLSLGVWSAPLESWIIDKFWLRGWEYRPTQWTEITMPIQED